MPDDDEEELHVGSDRVPKRVQRPAMVVLVAVAGLGAAFLTTRIGDDGTTPQPTRTAGPSVSSVETSSPVPPITQAVTPEPFPPTRVPVCPGGRRCVVSGGLPTSVVAALRDRYPAARVTSTTTLTAAGGGQAAVLLRRSIDVIAATRKLTIVVTPFVLGPDSFDRSNVDQVSEVRVESTGSGKTVSILLVEPRVSRPNDLTVLRLARDPRLAALS